MQRLKGFDMECEIDSAELLAQKGYLPIGSEGVCNTGDTFLTELSDVKAMWWIWRLMPRHGCAVPRTRRSSP